jgi:hypothetical protein
MFSSHSKLKRVVPAWSKKVTLEPRITEGGEKVEITQMFNK